MRRAKLLVHPANINVPHFGKGIAATSVWKVDPLEDMPDMGRCIVDFLQKSLTTTDFFSVGGCGGEPLIVWQQIWSRSAHVERIKSYGAQHLQLLRGAMQRYN